MKALGASATPLPWGEVLTALGTGLADGQFNAPGVSASFKLWDVNDYTTWSGHVYNTATWVVSETWFQSLPDEYKAIIVDFRPRVGRDVAWHRRAGVGDRLAAVLRALQGVHHPRRGREAKDGRRSPAPRGRSGSPTTSASIRRWSMSLWAEVDRITDEQKARDQALFIK